MSTESWWGLMYAQRRGSKVYHSIRRDRSLTTCGTIVLPDEKFYEAPQDARFCSRCAKAEESGLL